MITTFGSNAQLLEALNEASVEFMVVGGVAVHHYNSERQFDDLDVLINPTLDNVTKFISAMNTIGMTVPYKPEDIAKPKVQIPLKQVHNADIVTPDAEFDFDHSYSQCVSATINRVQVRIASKQDLISMKSTQRAKDISDVQLLS